MATEHLWQLLIDMGSEIPIEGDLFERYEPLRQLGLVVFRDGTIYKTDKGRRATANPDRIHS